MLLFRIEVTHTPDGALPEPRIFQQYLSAGTGGVVFYDETKHDRGPRTWIRRRTAEIHIHHLIARGFTARVITI